MFVKYINGYSITKKFYKNVKQDVVYLAFPQNNFFKIESICKKRGFKIDKTASYGYFRHIGKAHKLPLKPSFAKELSMPTRK